MGSFGTYQKRLSGRNLLGLIDLDAPTPHRPARTPPRSFPSSSPRSFPASPQSPPPSAPSTAAAMADEEDEIPFFSQFPSSQQISEGSSAGANLERGMGFLDLNSNVDGFPELGAYQQLLFDQSAGHGLPPVGPGIRLYEKGLCEQVFYQLISPCKQTGRDSGLISRCKQTGRDL